MDDEGIQKRQYICHYKVLHESVTTLEATFDGDSRHILQKTISDSVAANEFSTMLIGDLLKSRRNFIVKSTLEVTD